MTATTPIYRVERCRSHEVNSTPRSWETVFEGPEAESVGQYLAHAENIASGDIYRIVDMCGIEQVIAGPTECLPL